jgi:SAM-dependent methyltransferase
MRSATSEPDVEGYDPALFEPTFEVEARSFWYRARTRLIVSTLRRHFPGARSLLELGAGTGVVLAGLREAAPELRLVGADLFAEGLEIARRQLPDDVELVELDARRVPYESEFDVVGAFDVLEHLDDDSAALEGMARAARQGVLLLVPQHPRLWSELDVVAHHRRRYTRRGLTAKVRAAGLEVVAASSFVTTLLPAVLLSRAVRRLARRPYDLFAELEPPRPLNAAFERILDAERFLIERGVSLPVGVSLLLVARK